MHSAARERSPVVLIRPEGEGVPFVCVHAVGGTVLCYHELARRLEGRPFWALEAPGVDGGEEPVASVEALAERYLTALRTLRPRGPYLLGGWSFGGLVAYEMARRLAEEGEEVPALALLDSWPPGSSGPFEAVGDECAALGLMARALGDMTGTDLTVVVEELRVLPGREERLAHLVAAGRRAGALPPGVGPARIAPLVRVAEAHLAARRGYDPKPYPGRAVLFRAAAHLDPARGVPPDEAALGWHHRVPGGVAVEVVPGDHYSILAPPHVEVLAERLAAALGPAA